MTDQNYDPAASGQPSGHGAYGNTEGVGETGSTSIYSDLGTTGGGLSDDADLGLTTQQGVDDEGLSGLGTEDVYAYGAGASTGTTGASTGTGAKDKAKQVAGHAAERASDVKDTAVAKAAEVKDTALERGADVADVAKDELSRLAGEARTQVQDLWSQASVQLRDQVDTGRHQLADLLHALADELGEMASKSTQSGPLTSLAKQGAQRGGELSHWLANAEPGDLMNDIRRFARRRPVVFLGGAAIAGVLVGRLGRGLMAAAQDSGNEATRGITGDRAYTGTGYTGSTYGTTYGGTAYSVPATSGVTTTPAVSMEEVPEFGTGEVPSQPAGYPTEGSSDQPFGGTEGGGYR